jgi:hypothetical protein
MSRIVYISGPISGQENGNRPAFDRAAELLSAAGHEVRNPHELFTEQPPADRTPEAMLAYWRRAMRVDVKHLMDCDAILQLPGWRQSRGACWEWSIASEMLGMPVMMVRPRRDGQR